jgi:hypothetical protein
MKPLQTTGPKIWNAPDKGDAQKYLTENDTAMT